MPGCERRLLILGGTAEAAALAQAVVARFAGALAVTTSLAGRTPAPNAVAGMVRIGGFGGAAGLAAYLRAARIDLLVDATHPFAATISYHARLAAESACIERLVLLRPPWRQEPGDRWIEVADMVAAAEMLPRLGRCAFLAIGARELGAFARVRDVRFVVRLIAPPRAGLPIAAALVIGRPPFTLDEERLLLQRHAVAVMVAKASGGIAAAKLAAAREAGMAVIMVARPPPEAGPTVATAAEALAWIETRLGRVAGTREVLA